VSLVALGRQVVWQASERVLFDRPVPNEKQFTAQFRSFLEPDHGFENTPGNSN